MYFSVKLSPSVSAPSPSMSLSVSVPLLSHPREPAGLLPLHRTRFAGVGRLSIYSASNRTTPGVGFRSSSSNVCFQTQLSIPLKTFVEELLGPSKTLHNPYLRGVVHQGGDGFASGKQTRMTSTVPRRKYTVCPVDASALTSCGGQNDHS